MIDNETLGWALHLAAGGAPLCQVYSPPEVRGIDRRALDMRKIITTRTTSNYYNLIGPALGDSGEPSGPHCCSWRYHHPATVCRRQCGRSNWAHILSPSVLKRRRPPFEFGAGWNLVADGAPFGGRLWSGSRPERSPSGRPRRVRAIKEQRPQPTTCCRRPLYNSILAPGE